MTGRGAASPLVIAIDGGTSTTRARLVDVEVGRVVAIAVRPVGVRDAVLSAGLSPVATAVRACLDDLSAQVPGAASAPVVAAGMLSSEVGLADVPHVVAPAGLVELAAGSVERQVAGVSATPILFIPGVRTAPRPGPDGWAEADLMRGEECETLGAIIALGIEGSAAFLWPGSHTKLVEVDGSGRIARSYTTLAGEITTTLARQTLIAKSLPTGLPDDPDPAAVALGVRLVASEGLGRAAFLVRIADVTGVLDRDRRAAFWIGAVIGDDAARIARHPILGASIPIWVGGREPQRSLYAARMRELTGSRVQALDDDVAGSASAVGAVAVAVESGRLSRR